MKAVNQIYQAIEEDIRIGNLLPGDPIKEAELMNRFSVSRTPVREAMLQLEAQGLLTSLPRSGMVVAKMDVQQLLSMWELLAELECICVRLASERMTDDELAELGKVHAEGRAIVEANDIDGWQNVNLAFHEVLYRGSRNPYLRKEILRMRSLTGAYRRNAFSAVGHIKASYQQHAELVEAMMARDPGQASAAMVRHLGLGQGARGLTDFIVNLPRELLN